MDLTSIMLFLIIFFMIIIQICFRENYSLIDQKKFRKNLVDYYSKKYIDGPSDGNDVKCKVFNNSKKKGLFVKLQNKKICEGFSGIESSELYEKVKKCEIVNNIPIGDDWKESDWRTRLSKIPKNTIEISDRVGGKKKAGCGICYDNKKILFGDDNGPFDSEFSPTLCNNWIKPGEGEVVSKEKGGTIHKKNIFAKSYPFPDEVDSGGLNGIQHDSVKLHEQELCSKMKNCSDQKHTHTDGTPLCGWCNFGRMGDGTAVGMVRKGGTGPDQNDTKYSDDYCVWPRELDAAGKKTKYWGQTRGGSKEKAKEFEFWMDTTKNTKVNNPGKLMNGKIHCDAANESFPCFPNFTGKVSVNGANPKHSDKCYDSLWDEYAIYTPNNGSEKKCTGNIKERIKKHLPNSETFPIWDKTYIPSVEDSIREIPKRTMTSKQYNKTNPNIIENPSEQMMFSANQNNLACVGKELDPCDDRFRSRKYGYPRPKKCIDDILTTARIEGFRLGSTDPKYQPGDKGTHKYFWPVDNIKFVEDSLHYDMTNTKVKQQVKRSMSKYKKWKNDIKYKSQTTHSLSHMYDNLILTSYLLFGKFKEELIFWKDNIGGMGREFPWVKLCWEDFRKFMEQEYPNNVQIKKNGMLMIKKTIEDKICKSYEPGKTSCCTETDIFKCKGSVLTEITNGTQNPLILKKISTDTFITQAIYERKLFPFWRLLPKKYFVRDEWKRILEKKKYDSIPFTGSIGNFILGWDTGFKSLGGGNNALYATLSKNGRKSIKVNIIYNKTVRGIDYYNVKYGNRYLVNAGRGRQHLYIWVEKKCSSKCKNCRGGQCNSFCSGWNWCGNSEAHITGGRGGENCLGCDVDKRSLFKIDHNIKSASIPGATFNIVMGGTNPKFYLRQSNKYVSRASYDKRGIFYTSRTNSHEKAILFSG